jgi:hypothetical protein
MTAPLFLLGTHQPGWLPRAEVPLFVSDRRLRVYKRLPIAAAPFAVDSGGFTELQRHGTWTVTPAEYVARLRRYRDECGRLLWAAAQDWMCEPIVINGGTAGRQRFVGTRLSVAEHQRRTVTNFVQLRDLAPDLPIVPTVQGWTAADYLRCVDRYAAAGIDLTGEPLVALGSVCRRQGTREAGAILAVLRTVGVDRVHGFGFKTLGIHAHGHLLTSADSLAWSEDARRRGPVPGCRHGRTGTGNCANCLRYALNWRAGLLASIARRPAQLHVFGRAA